MERQEADGLSLPFGPNLSAPDPETSVFTGKAELDREGLVKGGGLGEHVAGKSSPGDVDGPAEIRMSVQELVEEDVEGCSARAAAF